MKECDYLIAIRSTVWLWLWLWLWLPNTEVLVAKNYTTQQNGDYSRRYMCKQIHGQIVTFWSLWKLYIEVFLTHAYNTHEFINSSFESHMILLKQYSRFAKRLFQTSTPTGILQRSCKVFLYFWIWILVCSYSEIGTRKFETITSMPRVTSMNGCLHTDPLLKSDDQVQFTHIYIHGR